MDSQISRIQSIIASQFNRTVHDSVQHRSPYNNSGVHRKTTSVHWKSTPFYRGFCQMSDLSSHFRDRNFSVRNDVHILCILCYDRRWTRTRTKNCEQLFERTFVVFAQKCIFCMQKWHRFWYSMIQNKNVWNSVKRIKVNDDWKWFQINTQVT